MCAPAPACTADVPPDYDPLYKQYASQGARVIALATKTLDPGLGASELRALSREQVEGGLTWAGFAVFQVGVGKRCGRNVFKGREQVEGGLTWAGFAVFQVSGERGQG